MLAKPHLVIYDITAPRRLRRGARVLREIDVRADSVRYIPVCARDLAARVVQYPPQRPPPSSQPPGHWVV